MGILWLSSEEADSWTCRNEQRSKRITSGLGTEHMNGKKRLAAVKSGYKCSHMAWYVFQTALLRAVALFGWPAATSVPPLMWPGADDARHEDLHDVRDSGSVWADRALKWRQRENIFCFRLRLRVDDTNLSCWLPRCVVQQLDSTPGWYERASSVWQLW